MAVINVGAAVVTAGSRRRRTLGVTLALTSMLTPWLVGAEHTLIRAIWVLGSFVGAMRTIDLTRGSWPTGARVAHIFSIVDDRRLLPTPPKVDVTGLGRCVAWEALAVGAYLSVPLAAHFAGPIYWVWRWFFALAFIYALSAGAYLLATIVYGAIGFRTPPLHIAPAAARSVQEFWGERWNRIVNGWLAETFFRPLARRRRPALGALAAFMASAVLHAYIVLVAVNWGMALVMLAYFLLQAAIIALERVLRVRAWQPVAGHAWTILWMVSLSPLFSEPALRAFGL